MTTNNYWASFFISLSICLIVLILIEYFLNKYENKLIDDSNLKIDNELIDLRKSIKIPTNEEIKIICNVPNHINLDNNHNPIGDEFIVYYSSKASKVFHYSKNCSNAFYKSNVLDVLDKKCCQKCSQQKIIDEWQKKLYVLKKQIIILKNHIS